LLTSTLVTLVVVPCVFALAERTRVRVRTPEREHVPESAPAE
jgi:hypothetical protein